MKDASEIEIREAKPYEEAGIIACIEAAYGTRYPDEKIYIDHRLRRDIETGELVLYLAMDGDTIAATAGFHKEDWFDPCRALVMFCVRPEYRGERLAQRMAKHTIDSLIEYGYPSNTCNIVTTHKLSSVLTEQLGLINTGYLFALIHKRRIGDTRFSSEKFSLSIHTLLGVKKDAGNLHIPKILFNATNMIYGMLPGVSFSVNTTPAPLSGETRLSHRFDKDFSTIFIMIEHCGEDLVMRIEEIKDRYKAAKLCTALIYLNISDESAINGCSDLFDTGCRFAGFRPLCKDAEYMVLADFMGVHIDFKEIQATDAMRLVLEEVTAVGRE